MGYERGRRCCRATRPAETECHRASIGPPAPGTLSHSTFRATTLAPGIIFGVVVVAMELACLMLVLLGNQSLFQSVAKSVVLLPGIVVIGSLFFVPLRYMRESVSALVRSAEQGDSRLAPTTQPQPTPLDPDDAPDVGRTIGPLAPLRLLEVAQLAGGAELALYLAAALIIFVGSGLTLIGVLLVLSPTTPRGEAILGAGLFGATAVFLLGTGIWCIRAGRKGRRLARARHRAFLITVQPEGVSWEAYDSMGLHHEYLAWRHAYVFGMAEYRASADDGGHRLYFLQAGETRLAWEWSSAASAEERAASQLLVRLAATKTELPLRDLIPGIRALEGALRGTTFWNWKVTRAQRPLAEDQPDIPGVPLAAIHVWNRTFVTLVAASVVLGLAMNALLLWDK